ncbi:MULTISPECIES: SMI1/KNR4 family protein [Bacillus]|jgi:hypothetical protein|uniref:SMI1/KNR4 family protein n=1 Tax=Bacillus TaxID=1386 RepID=UPI0005C91D50|nr:MULTISPECIES: SMI1/KNR4 family protein [Bacillus]KIV73185.1 hypothetical protein SZ39_2072 [Bacillus mycoides]RAN85488.1 SMI1 / KNR4 family protein [Bacillus sp. SRB_331]
MNINPFGNATEEEIESFEEFLGCSLPDDYKIFLRDYNGGTSKKRYSNFFVEELHEEIPLDVLYGINVDQTFDLKECHEEFEEDMLPESLIIGDDPGSGLIVLILEPKHYGVYYWDHSFYFAESSEDRNTYKIADSFGSFIEGLKNPL